MADGSPPASSLVVPVRFVTRGAAGVQFDVLGVAELTNESTFEEVHSIAKSLLGADCSCVDVRTSTSVETTATLSEMVKACAADEKLNQEAAIDARLLQVRTQLSEASSTGHSAGAARSESRVLPGIYGVPHLAMPLNHKRPTKHPLHTIQLEPLSLAPPSLPAAVSRLKPNAPTSMLPHPQPFFRSRVGPTSSCMQLHWSCGSSYPICRREVQSLQRLLKS